jgi:two-component sensor histidine kinase
VIYLFGLILFQVIYLGIAQLYFFSNTLSLEVAKATFAYISLLVIPIILFTIEFLNMYKFERLYSILRTYLFISPVIIILSYDNIVFNLNVVALYIPLGFIIIFAGFYALYKGEKQAKFYIAGWTFVIISLMMSVIKSMGIIDVTKYFYYTNEVAFVLEALLFSIALAHRIKILAEQKNESDKQIMQLQEEKQQRLTKLVDEKTLQLQESLQEKDTLYKELNHRVKNNLQMVLSLLNLQISKTKLGRTKNELIETKNRIISISNLYENLNMDGSDKNISTGEYCTNIVNNLNHNFLKKIEIKYHIEHELEVDKLVYFGLIVNELVTNSMKYAFDSNILTRVFKSDDKISITLYKEKSMIYLIIEDNGIGFEEKITDSLGLEIVKTLVVKQLLGDIKIESENGTKVIITWEENSTHE